MADWSDTKSILLELEQLFKRDDDIRDIEDIKKMAAEIEFQRSQHTRDLKTVIKQFTAKVVAKEQEVLAPSEVAHAKSLEMLSIDKENLVQAINKEQQVKVAKIQDISRIAQDVLALKEETADFALTERMTESRTSYALSLYSKISNISWDYAATASGDRLAGCIGNESTKEFRDFSYDTTTTTSFDIANGMWDMIAEGVGCE
mmetsp:Transcript_5497/g.9050  ORF Transcript_5497/g.9050 Transcript_5497/m.9050 type:complete len:203 (+) Transcript_5497:46-654(+)